MTSEDIFVSIPRLMFNEIQSNPDQIKHYEMEGDQFQPTTNAEFGKSVLDFAKGLISVGFESGDSVCIMGATQAKWTIAHCGTQSAGGVGAGIYHTCSAEQVEYIVNDAGAKILVLEDAEALEKISGIISNFRNVQKIVLMHGEGDERALSWDSWMSQGSDIEDDKVFDRINGIKEEDCVTLIYTSGTTGPPKGVMLSSGNCKFVGTLLTEDFKEQFGCPDEADYVSYLPLAHVAEQMFTIFGPACAGGIICWYCPDTSKLAATLAQVRPHILFGPPRVWEKFFAGISAKLPEGVAITQLPEPNKAAIKAAMGLDRCKLAISGAAPISETILSFFSVLGIDIVEIYGQSEGSGPTTFNTPEATLIGSVGKPIKGTEVIIADDDEILFRGPQTFLGYWNLPEKTAETLTPDGFVHSGDLGRFDEDGFLHIIGRKKDIIITSGGKNIAPANMENALKTHPLVAAAVVVGEARPYLNALISLDMDVAAAVAAKHGVTVDQFTKSPQCHAAIEQHVNQTNESFNRQEQVKKFKILDEPLSVENGGMTPTMKVKRAAVNEIYAELIEDLYTTNE